MDPRARRWAWFMEAHGVCDSLERPALMRWSAAQAAAVQRLWQSLPRATGPRCETGCSGPGADGPADQRVSGVSEDARQLLPRATAFLPVAPRDAQAAVARRRPVPAAVALLLTLCAGIRAACLEAAPGDWPEPRQNAHLTAFQPAPGRMRRAPRVLATVALGCEEAVLTPVLKPDGNVVGLYLAAGALQCWDSSGRLRWQTHPAGLNFTQLVSAEDLDGDGRLEVVLQAGRSAYPYGAAVVLSLDTGRLVWRYDVAPVSYEWYLYTGHYLPGTSTRQIIVLMQGYPPDKGFGFIALFAAPRPGAPPVQRWRYDFDRYTCFPGLFKVDLDGDRIEELAVETHSHMWFLDAATGRPKHYVEWDVAPANVRSYGLNRFLDVNGDSAKDFVVIANFAQHHEVLLNQGGRMVKAWHHGWAENVTTGKVETAWPEPPLGDVDGDGALEVILSMYNSEGEQSWLVRVYDAVSGRLKYRMPGMVAAGVFDLDGDGRAEVLANATSDPTQTRREGAHILKVTGGTLVSVWSDAATTAVKCQPPPGDDRVPNWHDGQTTTSLPGEPVPLLRRADGSQGGAQVLYRLGVEGETGPPTTSGRVSGVVRLGSLGGRGVVGVAWQPDARRPALALGRPSKGINTAFRELLAADLDRDGRNELLAWHAGRCDVYAMRGRSMVRTGSFATDALPAIGDLDGDGRPEVALVHTDAGASPVVEARTPSLANRRLWRTVLPDPGHLTLPWASRPAYLRTGRFTGRRALDLYLFAGVPVVRSLVLEGATGRVIWERNEVPGLERYWGPTMNLAAAFDTNGDGRDALLFTNPDYFCVADGLTGDLIRGPFSPTTIFRQPSMGLYTMPVLLERRSAGPLVCLSAGHYFLGVMEPDGTPRWYATPPTGEARCAREGFVRDEDGRWLIGFGRQNGRFACLDAEGGRLRWELPIGASCTDVAACDVDGDGTGEFFFGTSHGDLIAVGDRRGRPRIVWRKRLGAPARCLLGSYSDYGTAQAGRPIAADLTGDGRSEIIIQTADGRIQVLGAR